MIAFFIRLLVRLAIDNDRCLSPRLQRWVDRDPQLQAFVRRHRELTCRLRQESNDFVAWHESHSKPVFLQKSLQGDFDPSHRFRSARTNSKLWLIPASVVAASVAVAWLFRFDNGIQATKHAPDKIVLSNGSPATRPEDNPLADQQQIVDGALRARNALAMRLDSLHAPFEKLEKLVNLPAAKSIVNATDSAGKKVGQTWLSLEEHLRTEQRKLIRDTQTCVHFYTYRLPQAFAQLLDL